MNNSTKKRIKWYLISFGCLVFAVLVFGFFYSSGDYYPLCGQDSSSISGSGNIDSCEDK